MEQALIRDKNHCNRYSLRCCPFALRGNLATAALQQHRAHCRRISDVETVHFFAHNWQGRVSDHRPAFVAVHADAQHG